MPSIISSVKSKLFRSQTENATLMIQDGPKSFSTFVCQFNPSEYIIGAKGVIEPIKTIQGQEDKNQVRCGNAQMLQLKLYFDTSTTYELNAMGRVSKKEGGDVTEYTDIMLALVDVEGTTHQPPIVVFNWGSVAFIGIVQQVQVKFTLFEKGGKPVRAEVDLALMQDNTADVPASVANPKSSPDRTKCICLTSDKTLWSIANDEYGDSSYWREIARANGIMDPMNVPVGTYLKVPALEM